MRYYFDLAVTMEALERHEGSLTRCAEELRVPVHSLKTYVSTHAELQAITANRQLKMLDLAQSQILEELSDEEVPRGSKIPLAKWVLEKGDSANWNTAQKIDLNKGKSVSDMSEQELDEYILALGYQKVDAKQPA